MKNLFKKIVTDIIAIMKDNHTGDGICGLVIRALSKT